MTRRTGVLASALAEAVDPAASGRSLLRDPQRLEAVRRSGLLDAAAEETFDRFTRLATRLLGVPVSLLTVVDDRRQFLLSQHGTAEPLASQRETPLTHSFCQHVVDHDQPLVVANARTHELVKDNLAIEELGVEAYIGVPFRDHEDRPIGALCAIESQPREWTEDETQVLSDLAAALRSELAVRHLASRLLKDGLADAEAHDQRERVSRERFERLANNSRAAFLVGTVDQEFQLDFLSDAAQHLTGHDAQAFVEDPSLVLRLLHPDDREAFEAYFWAPEGTHTYRSRQADGAYRWLSLHLDWMPSQDDGPPEFLAIIRDVDAARRAELAQERALSHEQELVGRLRRVEEMKETFLTAVSHELRTPLTSIIGFTRLLADGGDEMPATDRQQYFERLRSNTEQLEVLITELIDVQHLASVVPMVQRVRIDRLVRQLVDSTDVGDHPVTVRTVPASCEVDRTQLTRALANVLANALRHTPSPAPIEFEVAIVGDEVVVTLADRGPGVSDTLKGQVFDPLTHGPEASDAASPGLGLGLTLARQLVELQHGRIWIEDRSAGGAQVRIALPRA